MTAAAALARKNRRIGLAALLIALAMLGLGYASVPLYRLFCQVTGLNGTTQKAIGAEAPGAVVGKMLDVRFDANVAPALAWRFQPEKHVDRVAVGAREMAFFTATNLSDKPITGTASFNVTPDQAGQYFTKIQCFCFTEQTLRPGETVRMPVIYYVDPRLLDDPDAKGISEITLSYTFFPVDSGKGKD
ncbi:cytochrome c oxidase assembly protein [Sphingomonas oleivorans]|uniref:Cytochrome c oxidase assembly protein CtaG n=1 Tax=Sphingomonas oleivorans TaxID=1735121 RepID=A0A2T5FXG7_9SPHN|nr:cytochrome c oxidase assembly protein [Sphingomonas oleivorans]PTQ10812.1 cytochrome c oxidase assembly protein [Sphingomonas oleivorans]